jgi:alpha-amylase/alpha-mannosidase (GH57 family)
MTGSDAERPKRYVIIHGHFYQPPRENPWLDIIEKQDSAAPYHDWNERIYDQCYRPNATSRLLDPRGMIVDIHNNYQYMSFNFGPTLFRWLEKNHPKIATAIVGADRESALRFKKHGNALAQVYNHMIMPLASRRDQLTQIRWAKSYFRRRFRREPEGIWLAETALNMETVTCLVEEGIKFVVLSPTQAESFRALDGSDHWKSVANGTIDTRRAYRIFARSRDQARSGGHLDAFFFDEGLSREVSFGDLLINASTLGAKIRSCYDDPAPHDQAVVIATDGETFGHHKPFGDMCLAYFFSTVAREMDIIPVNFAYFLEKNPPMHEVMLKNEFGEGTAWSCQHGVGRWSRDCGCKAGGPLSWNQAWRAPLRKAFDMLQKHVDESFVNQVSPLVSDAWKLRDRYLEFSDVPTIAEFKSLLVKEQFAPALTSDAAMTIRRLCEAQKYMLFSYTSCGWFFSDVSGIETVQNIAYSARALGLAIDADKREAVMSGFRALLSEAKSNIPEQDAGTLFSAYAAPFLRHLPILCFTAIVEKTVSPEKADQDEFEYYGYRVLLKDGERLYGATLHRALVKNERNGEAANLALLMSRDSGQLRAWCLRQEALDAPGFDRSNPGHFREHPESVSLDLSCVFEESKVRLSHHFLDAMSKDTEVQYAKWMEHNVKSLDSLAALGVGLPPFVAAPVTYVLTRKWNAAINEIEIYGREDAVFERLLSLWKVAKKYNITLDFERSAQLILDLLTAELNIFSETLSIVSSERMRYLLNIVDRFSIPFAKNKVEDLFHSILTKHIRPMYDAFKTTPDDTHKEQIVKLLQFTRRMNFNTDDFPVS